MLQELKDPKGAVLESQEPKDHKVLQEPKEPKEPKVPQDLRQIKDLKIILKN